MSKVNKKNIKREGFTLVELLAVIVIIAVIVGIATYTIGQTINKSKEKGKDISLDSVYKSAKLYLSEKNYSDYYWVINEGGNDTICIYIPELANLGYLKQKDIKNIEYKYIQISRDNYNKTIVGEKALYENNDTCSSSYGNGSNDRETTINRNYITTSSISIQAGCEPNKGIVNYVFTLKDNNDKLLKTIEQENHVAIFKNLTRLDGDKKYKIEAKCNYSDRETSTPKSILLNVGKSDIDFKTEKVVANSTEYYKVYSINYTTDNIKNSSDKDNSVKYFKVKGSASLVGNSVKIYDCGDNNSPSTCSSSNTTTIVNNHWYKTDSNTVNLKIESNPTIYALVWDGERYSSNESTQITFQSNPRVVWSIEYNGLNKMSGGAVDRNISIDGEDTTKTVVDYYGDTNVKWLGNPTIKWRVYGTDDIESNLYYADQNYNNRGNYKTNNKLNASLKDKEYSINSFSIYGRQQLGIVVKNTKNNKSTIIPINVNFDRESPTINVTSNSNGSWANKDIIVNVTYSDNKSGINKSTLQWKSSKSGSTTYKNVSNPGDNEHNGTWSKTNWEGNYTGYYKICDNAGNCSEASTPIKIDVTKPTKPTTMDFVYGDFSAYKQGDWTNKDIYVARTEGKSDSSKRGPAGSTDTLSGIAKYQISTDNKTWVDYNYNYKQDMYKITASGTTARYFRAVDNAGNASDSISRTAKIDKTAPTVTVTLSGVKTSTITQTGGSTTLNYNDLKWTNVKPTVSFSINDSTSTKISIYYNSVSYTSRPAYSTSNFVNKYNGTTKVGPYKELTDTQGSFNMSSGGQRQIGIVVKDSAGNQTIVIVNANLDFDKPSLKVDLSGAASLSDTNNSGTETVNYNFGNWTNVKPTVAFTITDSTSTKMSIYYNSISYTSRPAYSTSNYVNKYNGTTKVGPYKDLSDTSGSLQIGSGGQRQIAVYVVDEAGNSVTTVVNANLDYDNPTCTAVKPVDGWSSSGKTVDVTCSDSGSGCASGAGEFTAYQTTTYTVKDKAGNSGTCSASVTAQYWYSRRTRSSYCKKCDVYGGYCACARLQRANCPSGCRYSYSSSSSCLSAGHLWNSEGYCWGYGSWYYSTTSCSECGTGYGYWSAWSGYDYSSGCDSYTCESRGKWYYK